MKSFSLVKLLRATGIDVCNVGFSYEMLIHPMRGEARTELNVKDNDKNRDYSKSLKMRGDNNHAVRYLNSYTWTIVSKEEYEALLTQWNLE